MKALITSFLLCLVLVSCQTKTLQTFFVDGKEDDNFISLDLSLKTFVDSFDELPKEQQELFKDVNKFNFLAFKKDDSNTKDYEIKRAELSSILSSQYKDGQLMTLNSDNTQLQMYAENLDDTVDEIVLYANNSDMGFAVVRLLGDDLNPANFYKIMQMSDQMNFDFLNNLAKDL